MGRFRSGGWHSVIAGILPGPALQLMRAAQAGDADLVKQIDEAFAPLWSLFAEHGSLRLIYDIAEMLGLVVGNPPLPLRRANAKAELVIARLSAL
jgi:4-hydroxy-tetrahydrodipicolinate synthase